MIALHSTHGNSRLVYWLFFGQAPRMGRFCLYSHEVRDVRGVLTNLVHSVIAQRLEAEHSKLCFQSMSCV